MKLVLTQRLKVSGYFGAVALQRLKLEFGTLAAG